MQELLAHAERVAARLKARGETLAVAESSAGGLISAALLASPGASAFYVGGAVIYTGAARDGLLGISASMLEGTRSATQPYACLLAASIADRLGATWGLAESGASGPSGNRYGDAPGHVCLAVCGPVERAVTIETGHGERIANMRAFAAAALDLLLQAITY